MWSVGPVEAVYRSENRPETTERRSMSDSSVRDGIAGRYRGWEVVAGGFVGAFVVFGLSYAFGVFLEPMQRELGLSRSGISLVFSLQTVVIYVGAAVLGVAADRFGVRRLLVVGAALLGVGGLWTTRAGIYPELLVAYGVLTALGLGAIYVVSYATVPRWFERRRGLAAGIATAGLGAGMVVVAPAASVLVEVYGWRRALLALVVAATAAVSAVVPLFGDEPDAEEVPDGEFPEGVPDRSATDWATYRREVVAVATSGRFVLVFLGWVFVYATMYVVFVHLVAHAGEVGIGEREGALALGAIGATTALARVGVGALSDRVGRFDTFVACSAGMGVATLALPLVSTFGGLLGFAVAFGLCYGGNGALLSPLTVDLFGAGNPNAVFGLVSLSFAVSGLLAPWLAGVAFDALGAYDPAFVAAGLAGLLGSGLVWAAEIVGER